jgi:hypothetical protein
MATFTLPTNFSSLAITAGGAVTVGTNNDKTAYSLSTAPPTAPAIATQVWQDLTSSGDFGTAGSIGALVKLDIDGTISSRSTYAGADTSGTTTLLARLTSTRAGLLDNLDAAVSSRLATSGYTAPDNTDAAAAASNTTNLPALLENASGYRFTNHALMQAPSASGPTLSQIVNGVWDEAISGHLTSGSTGAKLNSAASAGDPLNVTVPGSYADHTVGKIISRLDIAPPSAFVVVIPGPPAQAGLCRVYGYMTNLNGQAVPNVTVTFQLMPQPAKSDRIIAGPIITTKTDNAGKLQIDLQRNDNITPAGSKYQVSCQAIGIQNKQITLASDLHDLAGDIP